MGMDKADNRSVSGDDDDACLTLHDSRLRAIMVPEKLPEQ
jgi:hypothetical protein